MMSDCPQTETTELMKDRRVAFLGRLASMSKREAGALIRRHGAVLATSVDSSVDLVVIGEASLPLVEGDEFESLIEPTGQQDAERFSPEVLTETALWQRLGLVEAEQDAHRLYTPAMLAELLGVPVAVIRRWHRRGLIVPHREVRKLAYFDFQEVATARRLAEMLAAGMSPAAIEKKLEALARYLPTVSRPLAQLSVIIQGKEILLRQGDGLLEPGGQLRFDFDAVEAEESYGGEDAVSSRADVLVMPDPDLAEDRIAADDPGAMCQMAAELEESGQLESAAEMYRAAMASSGASSEICFQIAELLYRMGDLSAARERYYMTIELDEDYVEARANLGCVLAETGYRELAVAAFRGALSYHPDYADVYYHLARTLDELGQSDEARSHWQAFLDRTPDSPWADQARSRLSDTQGSVEK